MPKLIRYIEGEILDHYVSSLKLSKSVIGEFGEEDYIKMGGFEAYLQDFGSNTDSCQTRQGQSVTDLSVPPNFGLKNNTNFVTIEISY